MSGKFCEVDFISDEHFNAPLRGLVKIGSRRSLLTCLLVCLYRF